MNGRMDNANSRVTLQLKIAWFNLNWFRFNLTQCYIIQHEVLQLLWYLSFNLVIDFNFRLRWGVCRSFLHISRQKQIITITFRVYYLHQRGFMHSSICTGTQSRWRCMATLSPMELLGLWWLVYWLLLHQKYSVFFRFDIFIVFLYQT